MPPHLEQMILRLTLLSLVLSYLGLRNNLSHFNSLYPVNRTRTGLRSSFSLPLALLLEFQLFPRTLTLFIFLFFRVLEHHGYGDSREYFHVINSAWR